jgi:hypothetical protein
MTTDEPKMKRSIFSFRLWHVFVLFFVAAWIIQSVPICGSTPAVVEITAMQINHDEQWNRYWATLDCKFIRPKFGPKSAVKQTFSSFFAVNKDFSFGDNYKVGDQLRFRFQEFDFGPVEKSDPREIILRNFFGLEVLPREYPGSLYVLSTEIDQRDRKK